MEQIGIGRVGQILAMDAKHVTQALDKIKSHCAGGSQYRSQNDRQRKPVIVFCKMQVFDERYILPKPLYSSGLLQPPTP